MKTTRRVVTIQIIGALSVCAVMYISMWFAARVEENWSEPNSGHEAKAVALEEINAAIGYDGMIHHFKNYVLRRDEVYAARFRASARQTKQAIEAYARAPIGDDAEKQALDLVGQLVASYQSSFTNIYGLDLPPDDLDAIARVDDTAFAAAIVSLRARLQADNTRRQQLMKQELGRAHAQITLAGFCAVGLTLAVGCAVAVFQGRRIERHERQLAETLKEREAASAAKGAFLANMSHEIRTPMTSILGYTEMVCEQLDGLDQAGGIEGAGPLRANMDTIRNSGLHLLRLIDDILDISKIEAGKMTVESIAVNPVQIAEEVRSLMQLRATEKGISLAIEYATSLPRLIQSDPMRLRQILVNLVGNAIKFTDQGGVTIRLAHEPGVGRLRFDVVDSGIGLSPAQVEGLFEAFHQANDSTTRKFGGSGLGLQISKRLADMLGGDVIVESSEGVGSVFTLTIAADPPDQQQPYLQYTGHGDEIKPASTVTHWSSDDHPLESLRILVAEDSPDIQRLIAHHLTRAGAKVEVVSDGRRVVERLTEGASLRGPLADPPPADLIITDMQMPQLDGYSTARMLRAKGCTLPILGLTAHAMDGDADRCLRAGCDDHLTKPIDQQALIAACVRWAGQHSRMAA